MSRAPRRLVCRIMRKVPDTIEAYEPLAAALLNDRHHGVLLTGVCLMLEVRCIIAESHTGSALEAIPSKAPCACLLGSRIQIFRGLQGCTEA